MTRGDVERSDKVKICAEIKLSAKHIQQFYDYRMALGLTQMQLMEHIIRGALITWEDNEYRRKLQEARNLGYPGKGTE